MPQYHKGKFLVSNSILQEKSFNQTVILLIEHNDEGAFGLILNRKKDAEVLRNLIEKAEESDIEEEGLEPDNNSATDETQDEDEEWEDNLYEGGPVRPDVLFILFSDPEKKISGGENIFQDIYLGTSFDVLESLMEYTMDFNIYQGYSGWGPGQLESEIASKTWIITEPSVYLIFSEKPSKSWREALMKSGGINSYFAENIKDPFLN